MDNTPSQASRRSCGLEHVFKRFGGLTAVNDVSVDIYPGEVIGLVGDNGAGKSTLIKMISGVYRPDGGRIYLGEEEITLSSPIGSVTWQDRDYLPGPGAV